MYEMWYLISVIFLSVLQPKDQFSGTCEQPFHTLSQHSMAIRGIYVGVGGMRCHIVSCSVDHTCKV